MKMLIISILAAFSGLLYASAGFATLAITATPLGNPPCNAVNEVVLCPSGDLDWIQVTVTEVPPVPGGLITCTATATAGALIFMPGENPQTLPQGPGGTAVFVYSRVGGSDNIVFQATSPTSPPSLVTPSILVVSPDIDASGAVNLIDFVNFAGAFLGVAVWADYDCNGVVNLLDFIIFATHYLH